MNDRPENWVFLGDSLTEGVGSSRISYVTELVAQLRLRAREDGGERPAIHEVRLRKVDPNNFNRFVRFNFAGYLNADEQASRRTLWLWNLACEGRTLDTDVEWMPMLHNLRPEMVVIFRGSLESIVRPAMLRDGSWPWWVPRAWRGYAGMDPRCYFSNTWWRKAKQVFIDEIRQEVRLRLLQQEPGVSLMDLDTLVEHYRTLLAHLEGLGARVVVLGLLPLDATRFPGSGERFQRVNTELRKLADSAGAEFVDWGSSIAREFNGKELFYRDGFHPNLAGARALAGILRERFFPVTAQRARQQSVQSCHLA